MAMFGETRGGGDNDTSFGTGWGREHAQDACAVVVVL